MKLCRLPGAWLESLRAWEKADFRPPARNRQKNRRKIDFGLTGKIGKNHPKIGKWLKVCFRAIIPFFWRFSR